MKRDMDLIRLLLLEIEGEEQADMSDYSQEQIDFHKILLIEAGLVEGGVAESFRAPPTITVKRLTWEGYNFLDDARDDTTWQQTQQTIKEKAISVSFEVLKALLIAASKAQFGLN